MRQSRVPQSAADLHQLLLSGHVVRSAYGNPRVFVPVAVVHERVHLHRFHGIRYGESAGFRIQSVRHAYVGADDGNKAPVYGLSMLGRFKNMGAKKPYLIYAMCDETFAVNNSAQIPADVDRGWFYFFVSLLNQVSWVAGATLGGIVGGAIDVRHHRFGFRDDRIVCGYFRGSMVDNETQKPYGGVDGALWCR